MAVMVVIATPVAPQPISPVDATIVARLDITHESAQVHMKILGHTAEIKALASAGAAVTRARRGVQLHGSLLGAHLLTRRGATLGVEAVAMISIEGDEKQ